MFAELALKRDFDLRFALAHQNQLFVLRRARRVEYRAKIHAFEHIRLSAGIFSVQNVEPVFEFNERVAVVSEVFQFQRKDFHTQQV